MTVFEAKRQLAAELAAVSPTARLDADCIMQHILGCDKTRLLMLHGQELSPQQHKALLAAAAQRRTGLPIAYITGHKEFYGLDFTVTPDVLIPKPDTELLVEHAVAAVQAAQEAQNNAPHSPCFIADICTGSGCIAVSVLHSLAAGAVYAALTDISPAALDVARTNAERLLTPAQLERMQFLQGDLLEPLQQAGSVQQFDMILSNPPYIPAADVDDLLKDGRSEPRLALDGDCGASTDGLGIIRRLIPQVYAHLKQGGLFLLETGEYNAKAAAALLTACGFSDVTIYKDMAGQLRLVEGRRQDKDFRQAKV